MLVLQIYCQFFLHAGEKRNSSPKGEALSKPEAMEAKGERARMVYFCRVV